MLLFNRTSYYNRHTKESRKTMHSIDQRRQGNNLYINKKKYVRQTQHYLHKRIKKHINSYKSHLRPPPNVFLPMWEMLML